MPLASQMDAEFAEDVLPCKIATDAVDNQHFMIAPLARTGMLLAIQRRWKGICLGRNAAQTGISSVAARAASTLKPPTVQRQHPDFLYAESIQSLSKSRSRSGFGS